MNLEAGDYYLEHLSDNVRMRKVDVACNYVILYNATEINFQKRAV